MKIEKANFDYEYQLFSENQKGHEAISQELEYLYFFAEKNPGQLLTQKNYSTEYLDHVASVTGSFPTITHVGKANCWWGSLENLNLEKRLNSKLTSTQFAIESQLCHEKTKIIKTIDEIVETNDPMVLKDPYQMSGRGFFHYDKNTLSKAISWAEKKLPLIQDPWLKKIHDLGSYYFSETQEIINYLNFSNPQGNYKGTRIYLDPIQNFAQLSGLGIDLDRFFEKIVMIKDHYLNLGATSGFSIDSFTYEERAKVHCYYLSEVNYRKTMGWVTYQCRKYLGDFKIGELFIHKKKHEYKSIDDLKKVINHEQVMLLSPLENQFMLFFIKSSDKKEMNALEETLSKL